jgi:hypothetical protein
VRAAAVPGGVRVRLLLAAVAATTLVGSAGGDGFRLSGPGVNKTTGAAFTGTVTWRVTLTAGRYSFGSARFAKSRKALIVSA